MYKGANNETIFYNFLPSMPEDQRTDTLGLINIFLNEAFSFGNNASVQDMANTFLSLAADPQYSDELAYFLAYTIQYEQENPELAGSIVSILNEFGMGEYTKIIGIVHNRQL